MLPTLRETLYSIQDWPSIDGSTYTKRVKLEMNRVIENKRWAFTILGHISRIFGKLVISKINKRLRYYLEIRVSRKFEKS